MDEHVDRLGAEVVLKTSYDGANRLDQVEAPGHELHAPRPDGRNVQQIVDETHQAGHLAPARLRAAADQGDVDLGCGAIDVREQGLQREVQSGEWSPQLMRGDGEELLPVANPSLRLAVEPGVVDGEGGAPT